MKNHLTHIKTLSSAFFLLISSAAIAQVGVNTTNPDPDSALEVTSNNKNKGFLPPRVALTSTSAASPLANHVAGMVVYNTATANDVVPGLYYNDGTKWSSVKPAPDDTSGTVLTKIKYRGRNIDTNGYNKPTLKVPTMNMEFRFAATGGSNYLEVRLLSQPANDITYYANELWFGTRTNGGAQSVNFTTTNWNEWTRAISNGSWHNPFGFQYQISTKDGVIPGSNDLLAGNFYGFNNYNNGSGVENEMYVLAFDQY
ncbi:hypothetical protein CJF12_17060 [Chryseobacterium piperi]|uniref:hypothetical protein n=1 Tax=Chryseobacterium piperi TaxID=558152 RepID=UPI00068BC47D|nr:hypothetical protein [Chryseobacterium piperi]ASW75819.2 hypothetical protein CJF12_17060 [Chryseobacterium piperi]